jgi:hypothetical protein
MTEDRIAAGQRIHAADRALSWLKWDQLPCEVQEEYCAKVKKRAARQAFLFMENSGKAA